MISYKDQIAVITGASSGIGRAIALRLLELGATVCLIGRELTRLTAVAQPKYNGVPRVRFYQADLSKDEDLHNLTYHLKQDLEHIDILVHSAGVISLGQFETAPIENLDWQYRVNVRGPYALTQRVLPMLKASRGQIVFINSSAGLLRAKANVGQYSATKHALRAIADSLRDEVNTEGVRVLTVYPGRTATPMQAMVHELEGKPYRPERLIQAEDVAEIVIHTISLPRSAEVTEISIRPFIKP